MAAREALAREGPPETDRWYPEKEEEQGLPPAPPLPALEVSSRQPRTPEAAIVSLERIGARVLFPPPDGQPAPPEASWDALAGAAELREQVEEVLVLPLKYPEAFASVRAGTRRLGTDRAAALLFYGPPGTGKTTAARRVSLSCMRL